MSKENNRLIIIDSDLRVQRQYLCEFESYEVVACETRAEGLSALKQNGAGVVVLELCLPPDLDGASEGLAALQEILSISPETKVVVVTKNADHKYQLKAIKHGAFDFYNKTVDLDALRFVVSRAFYLHQIQLENRYLEAFKPSPLEGVVACSPQMLDVCSMAARVAPTDITVLLLGASGTGKERIAQAIHKLGPTSEGRIVAINCSAIPGDLLESELFGHEKGAFTGAYSQKIGRIERADGGTLFLDEIGDLPLELQTKLLRFLQERVIERVGGFDEISVSTRIICATHRNLDEMIETGAFREDLYYRISEITLRIPALSDRDGDAVLLAKTFLEKINRKNKGHAKKILSPEALRAIDAYGWPGNVRELENKIKRASILGENNYISASDLDIDIPIEKETITLDLREERDKAEKRVIKQAMFECNYNVSQMAKLLGVARPTIYKLIEKYQLSL